MEAFPSDERRGVVRRRTLLAAAAAGVVGVMPSTALAAPAHVYVANDNSYEANICVEGTTASPVTVVVTAPDGQTIDGPSAASPISTSCTGDAGSGFAAD